MKLSNLNIGVRLACAFGLICGMSLLMLGIAISMLARINDNAEGIVRISMARLEGTAMVLNNINAIEIALQNAFLAQSAAEREDEVAHVMAKRAEVDKLFRSADPSTFDAQSRQILEQAGELNRKYSQFQDDIIGALAAGDEESARAYLAGQLKPVLVSYKKLLGTQMAQQKLLAGGSAAESQRNYVVARNLLLVLGVAVLVLSTATSWWITRSITQPVALALDIANTVAAGDLRSDIVPDRKDETGQLLLALQRMNGNLIAMVGAVRAGTETIISASEQVASGSVDLSSRTERQVDALDETGSSIEALTSTVKQNADNALRANQLAKEASGVAACGGNVIDQVAHTMSEIDKSSSRIADIIGVVDEIAAQTNILALNASVEAARAGDNGRGFAVVANEVRHLAQRSADAAKEIKSLIEDSANKVEVGSKLVGEAGATMGDIVDRTKQVATIMAEISDASQKQTTGIEQINQAIMQIEGVTQQNAALVEETSVAATAMRDQAERLAQQVSAFRLTTASMEPHFSSIGASSTTRRLARQ